MWTGIHITFPIALREMWVSSPNGAADTEICAHYSPETDLRH
jgi:hypothetical protein